MHELCSACLGDPLRFGTYPLIPWLLVNFEIESLCYLLKIRVSLIITLRLFLRF